MTTTQRNARSIREAGQRYFNTVYRQVTGPPPAFLGARLAREAAAARITARETLRVGVWESEGGALAGIVPTP
ncbi:hypothetical protein DSM104443_03033 [Usitatibacter rugosus]|uniref:Uncharacterized protein n=1 Tax=Usitatibacter rugosus TaxID=2732067 RepID=A0A6M4GXE5_9PROT|nr:hypothetical protein [Usitatibacter rugosus]QJR11950.1 hypothetical protein DSM104443_03033 [Usitatibacter rugosus]